MPVTGTARNYQTSMLFEVNFDLMKSVDFMEVDGLKAEVGRIIHREGGSVIPISIPGNMKEKTLTLKRGQCGDFDLFTWFSTVVLQSAAGVGSAAFGLADGKYRRNGEIIAKDRDSSVMARWGIFGAWVMSYDGGKWDNNAENVVVEEVSLSYDYFDRIA